MDIEEFVITKRQKLQAQKNRLMYYWYQDISTDLNSSESKWESVNNNFPSGNDNNSQRSSEDECNSQTSAKSSNVIEQSANIDLFQPTDPNLELPEKSSQQWKENLYANPSSFNNQDINENSNESVHKTLINTIRDKENTLTKADKEFVNQQEIKQKEEQLQKSYDDMEEWVSDTFYSYFPSFNKEAKKRESLLRDRQIEYQNYLKQMSNEAEKIIASKTENGNETEKNTARSDKTELEIIVNNPTYSDGTSSATSPRPGSTRHKLLQDLSHLELANIINSNAVQERNRRSAELESKKKKEYQQELLRQIEEKRNEIDKMKEKEKRDEEMLTRKLEEQLKAMQLEEEREREKRKREQSRLLQEQNLRRAQLLSKLERDQEIHDAHMARYAKSENDKESARNNDNKVYKYFSNSARHPEYGRYGRQSLFDLFDSDIPNLPPVQDFEKVEQKSTRKRDFECSHISKNLCPFCEIKLKNYESWCQKCEKQILDDGAENRAMLCERCQDQYLICAACEKQNTSCYFCHHKRNFCFHCVTNFCIHCGKSIRDHTQSNTARSVVSESRSKPNSERSFQILELSYPEDEEELEDEYNIEDNYGTRTKPSYSMNFDKNSIFHPDNRVKEPKVEVNVKNGEISVNKYWEDKDLETVKNKTNDRLSKYLRNYGDIAVRSLRNKGTQTTEQKSTGSPNEYSSMPLLREIPKKKMSNSEESSQRKQSSQMDQLTRKWEIPVVQKQFVSRNNPRVITQLGSMRKQLQAERLGIDS